MHLGRLRNKPDTVDKVLQRDGWTWQGYGNVRHRHIAKIFSGLIDFTMKMFYCTRDTVRRGGGKREESTCLILPTAFTAARLMIYLKISWGRWCNKREVGPFHFYLFLFLSATTQHLHHQARKDWPQKVTCMDVAVVRAWPGHPLLFPSWSTKTTSG